MPTKGDASDRASAIAFVKDYYARLQQAGRTGDVRPLLEVQTPDCLCQAPIKYIRKAKAAGIRAPDEAVTVIKIDPQQVFKEVAVLVVTWETNAYAEVRDGKVVQQIAANKQQMSDVFLSRRSGRWFLVQRTSH